MFSQDSSNVTVAKVSDQGLLNGNVQVSVPPDSSANFAPFDHVPNLVPLDQGVTVTSAANSSRNHSAADILEAAWLRKKAQIFAGRLSKPDAEDPDTVNHLNWYQTTGFVRPYPGETRVRHPKEFTKSAPPPDLDD